jgi:uncharacterized DUF497 family protein
LAAFEWDERKRLANLTKHGIDFRDAVDVFERPHLTVPSAHGGEERRISLGLIREAVVAVVWTDRGGAIRIISVRAARRNERQIYHARCGA